MADAYITRRGGGASDVVNAVVQECLAQTGTIDANTFVEFCGSLTASDPETLEFGNTPVASSDIWCIRDAVVYGEYVVVFMGFKGSGYAYGVLASSIKFSNGTATIINTIVVKESNSSVSSADMPIVGVAFPEKGQLVAYFLKTVQILYINNGYLSLGSKASIPSTADWEKQEELSILKVSSDKFIVSHGSNSYNAGRCCYCCTITSQNTITVGTKYQITSYYASSGPMVNLGNNLFGIFITTGTKASDLSITGYTLSFDSDGTITQVSSQKLQGIVGVSQLYVRLYAVTLIENKKFAITFSDSLYTNKQPIFGVVVFEFDSSNNVFNAGKITLVDDYFQSSSNSANNHYVNIAKIKNNRILMSYPVQNRQLGSFTVFGFNCIEGYISGLTIRFSEPLLLEFYINQTDRGAAVAFENKFIIFGQNVTNYTGSSMTSKINSFIVVTPSELKIKKAEASIDGLLQSTATTTFKGKVAMLGGE